MVMSSFLVYLVLFLPHVLGADVDPSLPFNNYLDPGNKVMLRWGFDLVKNTITFELGVNTTGWVGFGFSPNGGMAGADIVIGGVGLKGIYFMDMHATGNLMPTLDKQQDYTLHSLTETDGKTVMKFQRDISTCDEEDFTITDVPIKLIYAYGTSDNISYHRSQRGTKEMNLLKFMPRSNLPTSKFFDLTMTNFTVPAIHTYYHCKVMEFPTFTQKQHIYRIEPLIENLDLVHHLLLYICPPTVTETTEEACYRKNSQCFQTMAAWGVGGGDFELPEVAGIPVGGDEQKLLCRLEVHYNNQNKTSDRFDNSGLRFYYTDQLRPHDAAVLMTGLFVSPYYLIPPKTQAFFSYGLCDTSRIPEVIEPAHDLQVFSAMLHTHLTGRKVRVGQFRDGEQIDFLAVDEHYNFEFQQAINLGKTKTVKLGDKLLVECTYNTEDRTALTSVGLSTADEMCLAFFYYYPAMNLSICSSIPDLKALSAEMGAANETEWYKQMFTKQWDEKSIKDYQQTLNKIQQVVAVMDSAYNMSFHMEKIPELRASPSAVTCVRGSSEILVPTVGLVMLLWIPVSLSLL